MPYKVKRYFLIGHLKNRNSEEILQSLPPVSISHDGLLEISQEIVHWRRLAQRLGLTPAKIVEIRENNKSDYLEQKLQMLQQWKRANGRLATWRALVCAVIEENDYELVDKIVTICKPCSFIVMLTPLKLSNLYKCCLHKMSLSVTNKHGIKCILPKTQFVDWLGILYIIVHNIHCPCSTCEKDVRIQWRSQA